MGSRKGIGGSDALPVSSTLFYAVAVLVSIGCRSRTSSPRLGDCGTHHIHITRATRGRGPALRLAPRWMPTTVNARDIGAPWGPLMIDAAPNRWRMLKHAGRTVLILGALRNAPVRVATLPKLDVVGSSPIARSFEVLKFKGCSRRDPNGSRRFFLLPRFGTRWGADFAEPQLATHLRRLRAEFVGLPILVYLLPRSAGLSASHCPGCAEMAEARCFGGPTSLVRICRSQFIRADVVGRRTLRWLEVPNAARMTASREQSQPRS